MLKYWISVLVLVMALGSMYSCRSRHYHMVEVTPVKAGRALPPGANPDSLLADAWKEARLEVAARYPQYSGKIDALQMPGVKFRDGHWYDPDLDDYVVGVTDADADPPIQIGITGDLSYDYGTEVHEFKHLIVERLGLGDEANEWIDESDDQVDDSDIK